MNVPTDDKRFLDLLQKWQSGDFTRSDEQELQALARSDDFRKEAWEGFLTMPEADHQARITALRARLQPKKKDRVVLFPQMLAAAAAIAVLIAAMWFFRPPAPDQVETMAKNETPAVQSQPPSDAFPPPPPAAKEAEAPERSKSAAPAAPPSITKSPQRIESDEVVAVTSDDQTDSKIVAGSSVVFRAEQAPVIQPAPSEAVEDKIKESAADLAMEEVAKKDEAKVNSEMARQDAFKKTTSAAKPKSAPGQPAPANSMQTADFEMMALEDYLRRNARLPEAARQNNVSGYIRVSFQLDANRKPTDFKIIRALGYGCDEEALRLLKAYNWRDFNKDSLTVEVPFVR